MSSQEWRQRALIIKAMQDIAKTLKELCEHIIGINEKIEVIVDLARQ